jgi:hypothetical protein
MESLEHTRSVEKVAAREMQFLINHVPPPHDNDLCPYQSPNALPR